MLARRPQVQLRSPQNLLQLRAQQRRNRLKSSVSAVQILRRNVVDEHGAYHVANRKGKNLVYVDNGCPKYASIGLGYLCYSWF